jgi:hypothetical protein
MARAVERALYVDHAGHVGMALPSAQVVSAVPWGWRSSRLSRNCMAGMTNTFMAEVVISGRSQANTLHYRCGRSGRINFVVNSTIIIIKRSFDRPAT